MFGSWRLWKKLARFSIFRMQKSAGAHAVANVRRANGKEDLLPAKWVEGGDEDKDRTGWKVKGLGDKRYDGAVHGKSSQRLGKADVIHINEDDTEQGTWAECAIDNAFQLDRERYLFRNATVAVFEDAGGDGDGQFDFGENGRALADGGATRRTHATLHRPGELEDALVPLTSRAGYDGQVISWNQYSTLKNEQSDQETVREAKNQAWAAAKLDDISETNLLKWVLILSLIGAVLLFHAEIGAFIAGLSGGGGGGAGGAVGGALGLLPFVGTEEDA